MEIKRNPKITYLIIAINLLILALYQLHSSSESYDDLISAFYIVGHCAILAVLTVIFYATGKSDIGQGLGISITVVLLIGYGTCAMM